MTLEPGRKLDALVAEKVMGWKWYNILGNSEQQVLASSQEDALSLRPGQMVYDLVPCYSTDIAAAWLVVERLLRDGIQLCILPIGYHGGWEVRRVDPGGRAVGQSSFAPHAICLATLKAVGVEID